MNIQTINYISMIAGFAADQLTNGKTLKASKAWLADAMNADATPYDAEGVDFEVVNSRPNLLNAVNITTKAGFVRQCETMVTKMIAAREDSAFDKRINHAITVAKRDHNVELTAAAVIEWAKGDVYFNFTKCAHELAHEALEAAKAEEFEIVIRGSVGVNNPFHKGDVVYFGSIQHMKATVTKLPKIGDVIRATGGLYNATEDRVKVREILNDCPPRPEHLEAAMAAHHYELFSGFFNDRAEPTPERKRELEDMNDDQIYVAFAQPVAVRELIEDPANVADTLAHRAATKRKCGRPRKVVHVHFVTQISEPRHAVATFHIHLSNGKRYEYTEGRSFAHTLSSDNRFKRMTRSPHIVAACKDAITIHRKIA